MSGHTSNVIRLVVSNSVFTNGKIAEFDFRAIPEFVDFGNSSERGQAHAENLQKLCVATHVAVIILGRSKSELIELVKSMDKGELGAAELHRGLTSGRELAAALLAMMTAAETRIAAALAA